MRALPGAFGNAQAFSIAPVRARRRHMRRALGGVNRTRLG